MTSEARQVRIGGVRAASLIGPAALLISLVALGWSISSSFFWADDFVNFEVAHQSGLDPSLLNAQLFGHWVPGRRFLDWAVQRHRPVNWNVVLVATVAVVGVCAVLLRALVLCMTGHKIIAWAAAVILPVTAGISGTVGWYSGAAEPLPAMPLALGALILQLRFLRHRSLSSLLASLALVLASLAFDERAIALYGAFPILILLIEAPRRWGRTAVVIGTSVLGLAAYLAGQRYFTVETPPTARPDPGVLVDFTARGILENTLPGLVGLPAGPLPPALSWGVGLLIVSAFIIVAILARRATAVLAMAWLLAVSAALFAATGWIRAAEFGASSATEPRYAAALMPVGLIVAAIAADQATKFARGPGIGSTAGAIVAASAVAGLVLTSGTTPGAPGRQWWSRVEAAASSHPGQPFFDTEVPARLVPPAFFPATLLSNVGAVLDPSLSTVPRSDTAWEAKPDGTVVRARVVGTTDVSVTSYDGLRPDEDPGCWRIVGTDGSIYMRLATAQHVPRLWITGSLTSDSAISATIFGAASDDDVRNGYGASASVPVGTGFAVGLSRQRIGSLRLAVTGDGSFCLSDPTVGALHPIDH